MLTAAVLLATKVMFTGVVGLVPSAKDPDLVRVIAPNGREPNDVEEGLGIPAHATYVMFRVDDLVSTDPEKSRQPDKVFTRDGTQIGLCWIEGEYLKAGAFSSTDGAPDTNDLLLTELFPCCRTIVDDADVKIDRSLLVAKSDPQRVSLRLNITHGRFALEQASFDPDSSFVVDVGGHCRPLPRLVSVTIDEKVELQTLTITSQPFRGTKSRKPLKLARRASSGDLSVLVGNEPPADIEESADFLLHPDRIHSSHAGSEPDRDAPHMRILDRLMVNQSPVLVPRRIKAENCVEGQLQKPKDGGTGKAGACNPPKIGASDPPSRSKSAKSSRRR